MLILNHKKKELVAFKNLITNYEKFSLKKLYNHMLVLNILNVRECETRTLHIRKHEVMY